MSVKVLVTGGNGFIGHYVVEQLNARGHEAVIFDHSAGPAVCGSGLAPNNEVFLGDIRDASAVTEAMAHVDGWIHLAGVLGTAEAVMNPRPAAETNIMGGLNIFEAAAQYGIPGVNIAVGNWFEDNTYSLTKNCVERFSNMYRNHRNTPITTVRALNAYGPRQSVAAPYGSSKVRKIMPSFIMRALCGHPVEVYGDGDQIMDMVYVGDVAHVLVAALEYTLENGAIDASLDAGTGRRTSVLQIAREVVKAANNFPIPAGPVITHLPMRPGETPGAIVLADTKDAYEFGLMPEELVTLEEGVMRTTEWYWNDNMGLAK